MQKTKFINALSILLLITIFIWLITVYIPYTGFNMNLINKKEAILTIFLDNSGYDSLQNIVISILPFGLAFDYILFPLAPYYITRFESKTNLCGVLIKRAIIFSLSFVLLRVLVNMILSTILFGYKELVYISFYRLNIINLLFPVLFYIKISLIIIVLNYLLSSAHTSFLIFGVNLFEYLILKLNIVDWIPSRDSSKISMMLSGTITLDVFLTTLVRSVLYVLIVGFIGIHILKDCDHIRNEKK